MYKYIITKPVLVGLILLYTASLTIAGARKPREEINASMRLISASEIMTILQKFPEMVPDYLKDEIFNKQDINSITDFFQFSKIENVPYLSVLFPNSNFYKGLGGGLPPYPYIIAVSDKNRYNMPSNFNQLLIDYGIEINDKNIIELAKAFVILAVGNERVLNPLEKTDEQELLSFPQITFLEGKRSIDKKKDSPTYRVNIKTEINNQKQDWGFVIGNGFFQWATRKDEGKTAIMYYDFVIPKKSPKSGSLLDGEINISTTSPSNATVEWEKDNPHYYLIVDTNGYATNYSIIFELSGFKPKQENIAILVKCIDTAYANVLLFQPVEINEDGNGSFLWTPCSETTCITRVWAIDTEESDTTRSRELTLEKVITEGFPDSKDSLSIYFCDQFFINHPNGPNHSLTFANYVKNAAIESWTKQVNEWGLGKSILL